MSDDEKVPIIHDPGGAGWPAGPRTTVAEDRLYGADISGPVRLLGQATVATEEAYSLLCKASGEDFPARTKAEEEGQQLFWNEMIRDVYAVHEATQAALLEVAQKAIARRREFRFARDQH